jgi:2-polyprenyl-6-methoxyphenol hydroxylase-like FAD-dependent oxidoreductase
MKINVIGGGPAGLYFAILMKKADPSDQIRIYERNGPDDTFGWGVVFSGKTLANLRAADEESHAEVTKQFAAWDNVDVAFPELRDCNCSRSCRDALNSSESTLSFEKRLTMSRR